MYTLVLCGPLIYRTAIMEHMRAARGDIRVSGSSNHSADAPALLGATMPDALVAISAEGPEVARRDCARIRRVDLQARVVWWALRSDASDIVEAVSDLDVSVVPWAAQADELIAAMGVPRIPVRVTDARPKLTSQEHLILQLAADGLPNRAIALRLGVAESTVKNHFRHIGAKFNTKSRAQAVWQAVQWGYLTQLAANA